MDVPVYCDSTLPGVASAGCMASSRLGAHLKYWRLDLSLTHAILGVLEAQPMNGYELAQFFDTQASWVWSAPRSQIYPLLRKMEEGGLVQVESQIRGTKLERRVYSITPSGLEELKRWVATPLDTTTKRDPVFLQALLFDLIAPEQAVEILRHIIEEQGRVVVDYERHAKQLREVGSPMLHARLGHRPASQHDLIRELKARVFEGSAAMGRARIGWAEEELKLLSKVAARSKPGSKTAAPAKATTKASAKPARKRSA